jgi:hypothetical protein
MTIVFSGKIPEAPPMQLDPVVLEHAAAFIGYSPWEASRDAGLLAAAQIAAHQFYGHQPVISGMDVYNVEAEAWGATVERPVGYGVPVLGAPLFSDPAELLKLPPLDVARDGRLPLLVDAARIIAGKLPGVAVRIALAGPFSIVVGLLGFETCLMGMLDDGEGIGKALQSLGEHQARLCADLAALGFSTTLYESGAAPPLVSQEMFSNIVAPALEPILNAGRAAGAPVACIVGGDMAPIVDRLLQCEPGAVICPAETDQKAFMEKAARHPGIAVRINLPATLMASGDEAAIQCEIRRVSALARLHPRASLGTGVLPYNADPQRVLALCRFAESLK